MPVGEHGREGRMATAARQRGGAVIEFAFVFPILFLLIYGTVVYGYVFVVNESIHYAAKEAAESAVRVDPNLGPEYDERVTTLARSTVVETLRWMPVSQLVRVTGDETGSKVEVLFEEGDSGRAVRVRVTFDVLDPSPLFPVVRLPMVGPVPPLPERLRASAIALI